MKIKDILQAKQSLDKLNNAKGLSAVVAFKISKNIKLINDELKSYDEARTKVLVEASDKDEKGNAIINKSTSQYQIPDDKLEKVFIEIQELQNEEVDIDFKKIKIEDLTTHDLTPLDFSNLDFMLEGD